MTDLHIRDYSIARWLTGGRQRLPFHEMFGEYVRVHSSGAMFLWPIDLDARRTK